MEHSFKDVLERAEGIQVQNKKKIFIFILYSSILEPEVPEAPCEFQGQAGEILVSALKQAAPGLLEVF